jgi:hypothetical protein
MWLSGTTITLHIQGHEFYTQQCKNQKGRRGSQRSKTWEKFRVPPISRCHVAHHKYLMQCLFVNLQSAIQSVRSNKWQNSFCNHKELNFSSIQKKLGNGWFSRKSSRDLMSWMALEEQYIPDLPFMLITIIYSQRR